MSQEYGVFKEFYWRSFGFSWQYADGAGVLVVCGCIFALRGAPSRDVSGGVAWS